MKFAAFAILATVSASTPAGSGIAATFPNVCAKNDNTGCKTAWTTYTGNGGSDTALDSRDCCAKFKKKGS